MLLLFEDGWYMITADWWVYKNIKEKSTKDRIILDIQRYYFT